MEHQKLHIGTGRIKGLNDPPYYFAAKCFYAWSITFSDTSTLLFNNLPFIKVGDTKKEGEECCNQLKELFKSAHIQEGDKVYVIFKDDGTVIAIGNDKLYIGLWIDVTDKFVKKTFAELELDYGIDSLKYHL